MLSAGERPQLPVPSALVNSSSNVPVNRVRAMPDLEPNGTSAPAGIIPQKGIKASEIQHIWVVTGPAGCGKSTVGQVLRNELNVPFLEGDDYHPKANKEKMGNGIPLTDADRWDWLISLRQAATDALSPSESNNFQPPAGVVVACSALKKKYRDVMRVATYGEPAVQIHFVYLKLTEAVLMQRVSQRQAHYMKSDMVKSQLAALEEPRENEWDAITINVEGAQEQVQQNVLDAVAKKLAEYS
ncbi:Shikimate kinase [Penicillium malachiteum]|uniref:Gluconokinase n=1 Tax=Penicillium malachiteum TaxID=1324776 RepID=A0AAD6MYA0_9EURO|nr:Shikimate kinase [Penicillium malachiteum]